MNDSKRLLLLAVVSSLLAAPQLHAAPVCLSSFHGSSDLEAQLLSAGSSIQPTEIRLQVGLYHVPQWGFRFISRVSTGITISGGWSHGCTALSTSGETILDGRGMDPILDILNWSGDVTVRRITFFDGYQTLGYAAPGLNINMVQGAGRDVTVELNKFLFNEDASFGYVAVGAGLNAGSSMGNVLVRNNLFYGNTVAPLGSAAQVHVAMNYKGTVVSNTVVGNGGPNSATGAGGVWLVGGMSPYEFQVSNNIFWGNDSADLRMPDGTPLFANDIEDLVGVPGAASAKNLNVDPQFLSMAHLNFNLKSSSKLINRGVNGVNGSLTSVDLDNRSRVLGRVVDIGAYEFPY